ncbi:MAG: sulfite exporter TauE/SafE family protein [Cyanobacteria bacterium P01_C01_bin.69]
MAMPSAAHWEDMSTAKIEIQAASAQIDFTYPSQLTAFADNDGDGQISDAEITGNSEALKDFFQDRIRLEDDRRQLATLTVQPRNDSSAGRDKVASKTHTDLQLNYTWPAPVEGVTINYDLFVPNASEASCVSTISYAGQVINHVFKPQQTKLSLTPEGAVSGGVAKWLLSLAGAFLWGALHSMSPGHGKTLVAAYLVGERATPWHAIFLAMTTTITHTLGVFALGLITLFAARYILPEQLYPWLSLVSGSLVIFIGASLFWQRWDRRSVKAGMAHAHSGHDHHHDHDHATHDHSHAHDDHSHHSHAHHEHAHHEHDHHNHSQHDHGQHDHGQRHSHGEHSHSHLPAAEGEPVTWRSLLLLGFSAGLVPCPAALVLLLGAIAIGNPFSGLVLVVVFSLGLSVVLTALGLLLVYAKQMFKHLPTSRRPMLQWLPTAGACGIMVIGTGIFARSLLQIL